MRGERYTSVDAISNMTAEASSTGTVPTTEPHSLHVYVSLIAAHVDNEAAAAIRSCSHLVGDDGKALFIVGHVRIISRSAEHTRLSDVAW